MSAYFLGNLSCEHGVYMHLGRKKLGTVLEDDLILKVPPPPQRTTTVPDSVSTSPLWGGGTLNRSTRHLPNEFFLPLPSVIETWRASLRVRWEACLLTLSFYWSWYMPVIASSALCILITFFFFSVFESLGDWITKGVTSNYSNKEICLWCWPS